MNKRLLALFFAFCLSFTLMGIEAKAAETFSDNWPDQITEKKSNEKLTDQEIDQIITAGPSFAAAPAAAGDHEYDESEPNNTLAQADSIAHDYTMYGSLSGEDVDFFVFNLTEESQVTVVSGCTTDGLLYGLFDANSEELLAECFYLGQESQTGIHMDALSVVLPKGSYCLMFMNYYESYLDYFFYIEITEPHVHTYTTVVVEPTCETEGYTTYSCECGYSYTDNYIAAWGHDYTSEVLSEPICMTNGTASLTCRTCGYNYIEILYAPGHNYDTQKTILAPTCTENGIWEAYCVDCGDRAEGELPALGHDHSKPESINGKNHAWKCIRCDSMEKTEACTFDDGTVLEEATLETFGMKRYTCTVCGGTFEVHYIYRIAGIHRWETSLKVADEMKANLGVEKFDAIIIASGNDFADALAGSYLATVKNAPILLSWGNGGNYVYLDENNINYIKANLNEGGTVYILGGENAVPSLYETSLAGYNVKRLGGANRFETNLLILKEAGVQPGQEILVCTSTNFADSLSASATGLPILLVFNEYGKLYGEQPDFLAGLNGSTFCVVGGESAVSAKLEAEIGTYGTTTRLAGANRFETSVMVAEKYFDAPEYAVLAYAWNYPDGLCGGPLAYTMDAPLVLTMTKYEATAAAYVAESGIERGVVLGGTGLISDDAVRTIFPNIPEPPVTPEEPTDPPEPTEEEVYQSMIALQAEYPEGMAWTNDNSYEWNGGIYSSGSGCAGFAFLLSDAAFGELPARMITENISIDMIRVGDILRINGDTHSVIVLEVHEDYIVIAEGNYNSSIHWGRTLTAEEVAAADYILTRYPEA